MCYVEEIIKYDYRREEEMQKMNPWERKEICDFILLMHRHDDFSKKMGLFDGTIFTPERISNENKRKEQEL